MKPNWSAPLTQPVKPCNHEPLHTLSDVRAFILDHVPEEHAEFITWQHVGQELIQAAETGETLSVTIALKMVLIMNGCLERMR